MALVRLFNERERFFSQKAEGKLPTDEPLIIDWIERVLRSGLVKEKTDELSRADSDHRRELTDYLNHVYLSLFPPLFSYVRDFLPPDFAMELLAFCDAQEFVEYPYRGQYLKRSPKCEFRRSERVGTYRWGQEKRSYDWGSTSFPSIIESLVDKLDDPSINHVLIIRYTDGVEHHIPWHSDKAEGVPGAGAKDIVLNSSIYNVVVCHQPRRFQLALPEDIPSASDGHGIPETYVFDEALPNGSMIKLTGEGNRLLKHRVPKEKGWKGTRYSIVCRYIKDKDS